MRKKTIFSCYLLLSDTSNLVAFNVKSSKKPKKFQNTQNPKKRGNPRDFRLRNAKLELSGLSRLLFTIYLFNKTFKSKTQYICNTTVV